MEKLSEINIHIIVFDLVDKIDDIVMHGVDKKVAYI